MIVRAMEATGLPIITEIMTTRSLDLFEDVDITDKKVNIDIYLRKKLNKL